MPTLRSCRRFSSEKAATPAVPDEHSPSTVISKTSPQPTAQSTCRTPLAAETTSAQAARGSETNVSPATRRSSRRHVPNKRYLDDELVGSPAKKRATGQRSSTKPQPAKEKAKEVVEVKSSSLDLPPETVSEPSCEISDDVKDDEPVVEEASSPDSSPSKPEELNSSHDEDAPEEDMETAECAQTAEETTMEVPSSAEQPSLIKATPVTAGGPPPKNKRVVMKLIQQGNKVLVDVMSGLTATSAQALVHRVKDLIQSGRILPHIQSQQIVMPSAAGKQSTSYATGEANTSAGVSSSSADCIGTGAAESRSSVGVHSESGSMNSDLATTTSESENNTAGSASDGDISLLENLAKVHNDNEGTQTGRLTDEEQEQDGQSGDDTAESPMQQETEVQAAHYVQDDITDSSHNVTGDTGQSSADTQSTDYDEVCTNDNSSNQSLLQLSNTGASADESELSQAEQEVLSEAALQETRHKMETENVEETQQEAEESVNSSVSSENVTAEAQLFQGKVHIQSVEVLEVASDANDPRQEGVTPENSGQNPEGVVIMKQEPGVVETDNSVVQVSQAVDGQIVYSQGAVPVNMVPEDKVGSLGMDKVVMIQYGDVIQCSHCNYHTTKKVNWDRHIRKHLCKSSQQGNKREHPCPNCSYHATTSSNLKRHMLVHSDQKMYACMLCSQTFRQKIHLDRHIKYKHEEKRVHCPYCDYVCANENPDLKVHIRRRHLPQTTGEEGLPLTCKQCGFIANNKRDLKQHEKFHKKGPELKLYCERCSYVTDCPSRLKRHILVHTKEKPFACAFCSYHGSQKEHVLRHMRAKHNMSSEPTVKKVITEPKGCGDTGENFTESAISSPEIHEETTVLPSMGKKRYEPPDLNSREKMFSCTHCTMKFVKLINLYKHLEVQHNAVPALRDSTFMQCILCPYKTMRKKNMLVHMRKHAFREGEVPTTPAKVVSCMLCNYTNGRRSGLYDHMRKKHGMRVEVDQDTGSTSYIVDMPSSVDVKNIIQQIEPSSAAASDSQAEQQEAGVNVQTVLLAEAPGQPAKPVQVTVPNKTPIVQEPPQEDVEESSSSGSIQLLHDEVMKLTQGDYVEINGEMYQVEITPAGS